MIRPRWIIHPSLEELDTVHRFLAITQPDETDDNGVWVHYDDMERVWSGSSNDMTWEVRGGLSIEPQARQHLPARAIREALLTSVDDEQMTATILIPEDGDVVIVETVETETVIDLHEFGRPVPDRPERKSAATAVVNAGLLSDLLVRARNLPVGGSSEVLPDPLFTILDGTIAIHTDWSVRGAQRTTYRCRARTEGEAQCVVWLGAISDVVKGIDRESDVVIDLPADAFDQIILREPGAWSTYPYRPADARRYANEVADVLIDLVGEGCEFVEYGSFRLDVDERTFTVQLLDAPDPIVRIATLVCDGLGGMFGVDDLLGQLNDTNAGIVAGRLWFDEDRVWSAIDLPAAAIASIPWAIEKLHTQLTGFDVFLGAITSSPVCD